ncbi:hypothetical protein ACFO0N_21420 [Halobium salinum]|uniref:Uncharacterized protein n=1 Tax=Halobium salinum TaxID=1364940 RepID=A0ABD5PI25_9EURY|nr:hypothetical protein [Halobium salinum]
MSTVLVAGNLLAIALGYFIAYQSYRGYRRNDSSTMLFISIGFLLVSTSQAMDCTVLSFLSDPIPAASYVRTGFILGGMASISYSLYQ